MNTAMRVLLLAALAAVVSAQGNISDPRVAKYYSSPAFAIRQTPQLSELAKLAEKSSLGPELAKKDLLATIFAPTNAAVKAALAYVENATGVDPATLTELGVVDQLLAYHVAPGAALVLNRLTDGQVLSMLDKNKTSITIEGAAPAAAAPKRFFSLRKLQQAAGAEPVYYVNSDSEQQIKITGGNIQGGKSILHLIDGVLVPKALLEQFNISTETVPGYKEGVGPSEAEEKPAAAKEPMEANATAAAAPAKSGAVQAAAAALLAVPALLAVLLL